MRFEAFEEGIKRDFVFDDVAVLLSGGFGLESNEEFGVLTKRLRVGVYVFSRFEHMLEELIDAERAPLL